MGTFLERRCNCFPCGFVTKTVSASIAGALLQIRMLRFLSNAIGNEVVLSYLVQSNEVSPNVA